jgi:hypothetical protein
MTLFNAQLKAEQLREINPYLCFDNTKQKILSAIEETLNFGNPDLSEVCNMRNWLMELIDALPRHIDTRYAAIKESCLMSYQF